MESKTKNLVIEENGSSRIVATFDEGKEALEGIGHRIISLEDNARLRIQEGKDSFVSRNGNWTREGVIYTPNKRIFLTKNSPIMENPKEATRVHRNRNEYFLREKQVEQALTDSIDFPEKSIEIPTNRFGENEITYYAFGDVAGDYGKWLDNEAGIKEISIYTVDKGYINRQSQPFARQIWFGNLDDRSFLDSDRGLYDYRLRGVKMVTTEAGSQNLEDILKEVNLIKEKGSFSQKFRLFQRLNKKIDYFANKQMFEEANRLSIERDNLYKEMR